MSKGYPYDEDEFDAPVDPDGPHGVHRAPRSAWSKWWPFLVVVVVVPALTFAAVYWAMRTPDSSNGSSGQTPAAEESASPEVPVDEATDDGTEPTDVPEADAPVYTTQVMVINAGSGKTGLAGDVSEVLKAAGFTAQNTPTNGTKGNRTADTVYYQSDDLKVTADAVAAAVSEAQGKTATVEKGLPRVDVAAGETAPQIVVMLVNKPA